MRRIEIYWIIHNPKFYLSDQYSLDKWVIELVKSLTKCEFIAIVREFIAIVDKVVIWVC